MTDKDLFKQALEALEFHFKDGDEVEEIDLALIAALRERLAQPEQEPFGYFQLDLRLDAWVQNRDSKRGVAFYTAPQPRQWQGLTEEEVRKCFFRDDAPPSSPPYWWEYRNPDYRDIYALLDQALKEKNA